MNQHINKEEAWENINLSSNTRMEAQGSNVRGELPNDIPVIPESESVDYSNEATSGNRRNVAISSVP